MSVSPPRWYRLAWFLGRPPKLTQRQWRVLGLVAAVSLFEQYDLYLFALNLKQIQAELLISEADLGWFSSLVRAGSFLAIPLAMAADRVGRRRMLLITIIVYTTLTGATALSPNAETFVVLQVLARGFAVAETILATVVIVEEFEPANRGWGVGAVGAIQATGAGLASILYGFVEVLPYGWRALYLIGLIPLMVVAYWRRTLPETRRFAELEQTERTLNLRQMFNAATQLIRDYPARFWGLAAVLFFTALSSSGAGFFAPKYLQDAHGWTPADVAIMSFFGGAFAIIGNPLAGWLSDRRGRKPITAIFAFALGLSAIALYNAMGLALPFLWMTVIFFTLGTGVTEGTYSAELFPTKYRSTAASSKSLMGTLGGITSLASISILFPIVGSNWAAISLLAAFALIVPVIVFLCLPETAGRTLEEIAEEPSATSPHPVDPFRDRTNS